MKRTLFAIALLAAACAARPARAAELKILEPADRAVVKGVVTFRIQPVHQPTEMFFSNPDVVVENEDGETVQRAVAVWNPQTKVCTGTVDTRKLKDGRYQVQVIYKVLVNGRAAQETTADLVLGVRNGGARPARFVVESPTSPVGGEDAGEVTVRIYDQRGKLMPAAQVSFKVDKGEVDSAAEITDSEGEAFVSVDSDEAQTVTLIIVVEGLPPVMKTITFVE